MPLLPRYTDSVSTILLEEVSLVPYLTPALQCKSPPSVTQQTFNVFESLLLSTFLSLPSFVVWPSFVIAIIPKERRVEFSLL